MGMSSEIAELSHQVMYKFKHMNTAKALWTVPDTKKHSINAIFFKEVVSCTHCDYEFWSRPSHTNTDLGSLLNLFVQHQWIGDNCLPYRVVYENEER